MWSQVENDLAAMLAAKIYPSLLTDAVYRQFLANAGLGPNFPGDGKVPPAKVANFTTAAKIRAHIAVAEIAKSGGIQEGSSSAKLLRGPLLLYRFWESKSPARREGVWWFEAEVIEKAKREGGRTAELRLAWLREKLAVSIDWSAMDRIDSLSIGAASELPAVQGLGSEQRVYSAAALYTGKAEGKDYWPNLGKTFPGGLKQTVLPFIPNAQGHDLKSFLSRG